MNDKLFIFAVGGGGSKFTLPFLV
ncbi:uncharacterized protein METZ01_LOCUS285933 [marine metagenome]|uniref:Uncharacterized protein n=1 Tax=marine metagenome TaxID=408172 RepID=A0A382L8W6_9ZZZZ